jgi:hypothetical protein
MEKPRELENQNRLFNSLFFSHLFWVVAAFGLNFEIYFFWRRFFWLPIPIATFFSWIGSIFFAYLYRQTTVGPASFGKSFLLYLGAHLWYGILDLLLMIVFIGHLQYTQYSSKLLTLLIVFSLWSLLFLWKRKTAQPS